MVAAVWTNDDALVVDYREAGRVVAVGVGKFRAWLKPVTVEDRQRWRRKKVGEFETREEAKAALEAALHILPPCPCPNKRAYATFGEGARVALRRSRLAARPLRVYQCPCGAWHLTKKARPVASSRGR